MEEIINPCTDSIPSDTLANYILNSDDKMVLVTGLIERKRTLLLEVEELENKIESLERANKASTAFIHNLIKKLGDTYKKIPQ